jgi:integrase/recombinase XerD
MERAKKGDLMELVKSDGVNVESWILGNIKPSYKIEVSRFMKYTAVHGLTMETVKAYCEDLKNSGAAVSSINKNLAAVKNAVRSLFKFANLTESERFKIEGQLSEIKLLKVSKNQNAVEADKILSPEEIRQLVEGSTERTGLLIRFLAATGARVSEACHVKLTDCTIENGKTRIQLIGKGGKGRIVRIPTELYKRIHTVYSGKKYLFETRHGNPLSRENVYTDLQRAGRRTLGKAVSPHMLRHSFATTMIGKTGKIQAVSEYLGHSSTAITLDLYTHETLEDGELFGGIE